MSFRVDRDVAKMHRAVILWTGGKDSSLAFYEAMVLGYSISRLITFEWDGTASVSHPFEFIELQSKALDLPLSKIGVRQPYDRAYERGITSLKEQHQIDTLVTGDIAEVARHDPNWLLERAKRCGVHVVRPLWQRDRMELLNKLLQLKFEVVFSCVKKPWFTDDWLGTTLSLPRIRRLRELNARTGLDVCGEQGEYHTLTLDGPQFQKRIRIESSSKRTGDPVMFLKLEKMRLARKRLLNRWPLS